MRLQGDCSRYRSGEEGHPYGPNIGCNLERGVAWIDGAWNGRGIYGKPCNYPRNIHERPLITRYHLIPRDTQCEWAINRFLGRLQIQARDPGFTPRQICTLRIESFFYIRTLSTRQVLYTMYSVYSVHIQCTLYTIYVHRSYIIRCILHYVQCIL